MIRLFVDYFHSPDPARKQEYDIAFQKNCENRFIDAIYCLGRDKPPAHYKVTPIALHYRPTYQTFFEWINQLATADDISIIANLDIFFDDTLQHMGAIVPNQCYALSRWDAGQLRQTYGDSQDSWIFRGPIRMPRFADFTMGLWGCDNRVAHELQQVGYHLLNPCHSIRSHHVHGSADRQHERTAENTVLGPYLLVHPCNL